MRAHDLFLYWISARGSLRRDEVKAAYEDFWKRQGSKPSYMYGLFHLGHVEWHSTVGWCVTPSTLLISRDQDGACEGRLYGARFPDCLDALSSNEPHTEVTVHAPEEGPSVWSVRGSRKAFLGVASRLGLTLAEEQGRRLLGALPPLHELLLNARGEEMPLVDRVERFTVNCKGTPWVRVQSAAGPGFYRLSGSGRRRWYLRSPDRTVALVTGDQRIAAEWSEHRRHTDSMARYDPRSCVLSLPCRGLPALVYRALCWPSGKLPVLDSRRRWRRFESVEEGRAKEAARILGLELEIAEAP